MKGQGRRPERDPLVLLIRAARSVVRRRAAVAWISHRKRHKIERPVECSNGHVPWRHPKFAPPALHAHHDDYARPLEIRWLCVACHAEAHCAWRGPPCDPYRNCWDEIARICAELSDERKAAA